MDSTALASTSAANSRAQIAAAVTQQVIKNEQAAGQQLVAMIEQSSSNLKAVTSGSATQPGVGTRLDKQV